MSGAMASQNGPTHRAGSATRTGAIGTIVAAFTFFDGVFVGAPIALLAAAPALARLRRRRSRGQLPQHRLLHLGQPPLGRLVLGQRQTDRQEARDDAAQRADETPRGVDRTRLRPAVCAGAGAGQPDPRRCSRPLRGWQAERSQNPTWFDRLRYPLRRDVDARRTRRRRRYPRLVARGLRALPHRSRMIVTGPSFTSRTSIRAPKTPVSTATPRLRSSRQKSS
jgi:hypothetical protein